MRRLLALLCLLPLPLWAQEAPAPDPLRTNPLTGEPRSAFDPISFEETAAALRACLDRERAGGAPATPAALLCTEEARAFCGRVLDGYPLARLGREGRDPCLLNGQLAWGEVRFAAGEAIVDALYERVLAGEEAARAEAEAFVEEDGLWRQKVGGSCLGDMGPEARDLCELELQRDRAVIYLDRLAATPRWAP